MRGWQLAAGHTPLCWCSHSSSCSTDTIHPLEVPSDREEQTLSAEELQKGLPWRMQAWSAFLLVALHAEK